MMNFMMNKKERVIAAMNHQPIDSPLWAFELTFLPKNRRESLACRRISTIVTTSTPSKQWHDRIAR